MIVPSSLYPAQTVVDANYPQGKARNVSAEGDGTGFPFEAQWVNDMLGFHQALALAASLTPSGTPDNANNSQLLAAVRAVAQQRAIGVYTITPSLTTTFGAQFAMTQTSQVGGFSLTANLISVPTAGKYRAVLSGMAKGSGTTNPSSVYVLLQGGSVAVDVVTYRPTASASDAVLLAADYVFTITNPASETISLIANSFGQTLQFAGNPQLTVERVG